MFETLEHFPTIDSILEGSREFVPDLTLAELARIFDRILTPDVLVRFLRKADSSAQARVRVLQVCKAARRQLREEAAIVARCRNNAARYSVVQHFGPPSPYVPTLRAPSTDGPSVVTIPLRAPTPHKVSPIR